MFHETPKHARTDPTLAFLSYVLYHSWPTMKKIALSLFLPVRVYGIQGDLISVTLYSIPFVKPAVIPYPVRVRVSMYIYKR